MWQMKTEKSAGKKVQNTLKLESDELNDCTRVRTVSDGKNIARRSWYVVRR